MAFLWWSVVRRHATVHCCPVPRRGPGSLRTQRALFVEVAVFYRDEKGETLTHHIAREKNGDGVVLLSGRINTQEWAAGLCCSRFCQSKAMTISAAAMANGKVAVVYIRCSHIKGRLLGEARMRSGRVSSGALETSGSSEGAVLAHDSIYEPQNAVRTYRLAGLANIFEASLDKIDDFASHLFLFLCWRSVHARPKMSSLEV